MEYLFQVTKQKRKLLIPLVPILRSTTTKAKSRYFYNINKTAF